jgi:phosphoribosylformylglycinamidine cyclo-ligase
MELITLDKLMSKKIQLTYKKSGVDYSQIDPLKVLAQKAAQTTAKNLTSTGFKELEASRGESAYVVDCGNFYLASITECLGTKALVADAMRQITNKTYYDSIAQDTIAMAVNDIVTVGARPLSIHAYWATGSSDWFKDKQRMKDLVRGWKKACDLSGAAWGGGETPALKGVIKPQAIDLAASCVGIIKPKNRLTLGNKLKTGDSIIIFASSGIHANGLTLARKIAAKLPQGYATKISHRAKYGEALLKPTLIYAPIIQALFDKGINLHYLSNITGHGWLKLMRHPQAFTYRITHLPPVPPVLQFIVQTAHLSNRESYSTFNMGAGFAIFVAEKDAAKTLAIAKKAGIKTHLIGQVESGPKQVVIEPLNIVYKGASLKLRS